MSAGVPFLSSLRYSSGQTKTLPTAPALLKTFSLVSFDSMLSRRRVGTLGHGIYAGRGYEPTINGPLLAGAVVPVLHEDPSSESDRIRQRAAELAKFCAGDYWIKAGGRLKRSSRWRVKTCSAGQQALGPRRTSGNSTHTSLWPSGGRTCRRQC